MKYLFVLMLLILNACHSSKHLEKTTSTALNDSISLSRTACYGTCPVYNVQIFRNGKVLYTGRSYVDNLGAFQGSLSSEQIEDLFAVVDLLEWTKLPDAYPIDNVDFPQFNFEVQLKEVNKKVKANFSADESLVLLSKQIDQLITEIELTPLAEQPIEE